MSSQFGFITSWYPTILRGLATTLEITVAGVLFGLALGLLLAIGDLYGPKPLKGAIAVYVEFFRGSPLFVQIFIAVYGIPALIPLPWGLGNHFLLAFFVFGFNSAAYQKGYMKGAMETVLADQMDAGLSTGMTKVQTLWHVVIPQSLRVVIPSWTNEFCSLTKSSAALAWVGISDLAAAGNQISGHYYIVLPVWLFIGLVYFIWITAIARLADWVYEKKKIPGIEMEMQS